MDQKAQELETRGSISIPIKVSEDKTLTLVISPMSEAVGNSRIYYIRVPETYFHITAIYWGYGSCGTIILQGFASSYVEEKYRSAVFKAVYDALLDNLGEYSGAGQITFAIVSAHEGYFSHWLINNPPKGKTLRTHSYHNQAHPLYPSDPKSGGLVKVYWHHATPESVVTE